MKDFTQDTYVTSCGLVDRYKRFEEITCLLLQDKKAKPYNPGAQCNNVKE